MIKSLRGLLVAAGLLSAGAAFAAPFTLFAADTSAGSNGGNTAAYGGVRQYGFTGTGSAATLGAGLPAASLHDPAGLAYKSGTLFIGNRHGNTLGLGSVQSADWDGTSLTNLSTVATQSQASEQGFHGLGFAPNGDMFVTTANDGTIRYRDSGSGFAKIGKTTSGPRRDAWISPDGNKLYETGIGNSIRVTNLAANSFGSFIDFTVSGSNAMHQMAWKNGSLFVTSFNNGQVYRLDVDANFVPVSSTLVASVPGAIGIAFSPDGQEMFVSRHSIGGISRLAWDGNAWNNSGFIDTGVSMGYLQSVPEPGTMAALGAGLLLAARRRRNRKS